MLGELFRRGELRREIVLRHLTEEAVDLVFPGHIARRALYGRRDCGRWGSLVDLSSRKLAKNPGTDRVYSEKFPRDRSGWVDGGHDLAVLGQQDSPAVIQRVEDGAGLRLDTGHGDRPVVGSSHGVSP